MKQEIKKSRLLPKSLFDIQAEFMNFLQYRRKSSVYADVPAVYIV